MTNLLFVIAVKFMLLLFMLLTNVLRKRDTKSTGTDNYWSEIVRDKVSSESNQNHCKRGQRSMQCCHNFTRLDTNYTTYKSGFWLKIRGIGMFKSCFCNIQPHKPSKNPFALMKTRDAFGSSKNYHLWAIVVGLLPAIPQFAGIIFTNVYWVSPKKRHSHLNPLN